MGGLIGGGKKVKAPVAKKVAPLPEITTAAEDDALKKASGGDGFASTIITGDLVPETNKKRVFG